MTSRVRFRAWPPGSPFDSSWPWRSRRVSARGVALYGEGNPGAALVEFQRAYELLGRRPSLLFNLAVT